MPSSSALLSFVTSELQGTLNVTTSPVSGDVFLNDLKIGTSPISKMFDEGRYKVSFGSISGYITPKYVMVDIVVGKISSVVVEYKTTPTTPSPFDKLKEWWNSLSAMQKAFVILGSAGGISLLVYKGGKKSE